MISKSHRIDSHNKLLILRKRINNSRIVIIILIQGSKITIFLLRIHNNICQRMEIIIEIIINTQPVRQACIVQFTSNTHSATVNTIDEFRVQTRYNNKKIIENISGCSCENAVQKISHFNLSDERAPNITFIQSYRLLKNESIMR